MTQSTAPPIARLWARPWWGNGRARREAAALEFLEGRWPDRHTVTQCEEGSLALGAEAHTLCHDGTQQRRRVDDAIFFVAL